MQPVLPYIVSIFLLKFLFFFSQFFFSISSIFIFNFASMFLNSVSLSHGHPEFCYVHRLIPHQSFLFYYFSTICFKFSLWFFIFVFFFQFATFGCLKMLIFFFFLDVGRGSGWSVVYWCALRARDSEREKKLFVSFVSCSSIFFFFFL